jgi:carbamoyltransferase
LTAILGISAFYHDSAAALVVDGDIVAAAQEERFTRKKNDPGFPTRAIACCLREAGLTAEQVDYVVFYDKPYLKFGRLLETYLSYAPSGLSSFEKAIPLWLKQKLHMPRTIRKGLGGHTTAPLVFLDHHQSHAASAFFPSPFAEAAILTLDGVGEWSTTTLGTGKANKIELTQQITFPHSLGLLYSAFTYYCGFKVNSGEYKLMGLAPYGRPVYKETIYKHLLDLKPDGSFWMGMDYFNYCQGLTMTNGRFHGLFGGPPRRPDSELQQRHMDLAASIQSVTEDVVLALGRALHRQTGMDKLVLAGGVALNCVANGRLLREGPFTDIWIQPAAGDAGGALGAALFVWYQLLEKPRTVSEADSQKASLLGPRHSSESIRRLLTEKGAAFRHFTDEGELLDHVAQCMAEEKVIGWLHGRMEFGPRALGARSILGDARSPRIQATMNLKIKFRESFRPFAPCVLREHVHEWFRMRPGEDSPYMLLVAPVLEERRVPLSPDDQQRLRTDPDLLRRVNIVRSQVPAVTHVDYSARVQTVDARHGRFYRLMKKFHEKTGCPVIVNTSFNLSWEPIVESPEEAYHTFMQSEMDVLVLEDCVLHKAEQPLGFTVWARPGANGKADEASPWADPLTGEPLVVTPSGATNPATGACFPVDEGIPRLFVPTNGAAGARDVTDIVKDFYEKTPYPTYEGLDGRRALQERVRESTFARLLYEQIPYGARVLEVGCGTGQLTNYLSMAHRTVLGVDVCLNSLRLAQKFKTAHNLDCAAFAQMNLFRPALRDGFFDFVIACDVLHHTGDCRAAFQRIARLARPGGHVVVGLYNAYGRKPQQVRRALYRWTGLSGRWLDPRLGRVEGEDEREAWFQEQYAHPHETRHTLDEVLGWIAADGLEYVNSFPRPGGGPVPAPGEALFAPHDPGTRPGRVLSQLASLGNGYREGGSFIVIGRRRPGAGS